MHDQWQVFRTRYIPSILPLIYYRTAFAYQQLTGKTLGITVNIWEKGDYTVLWGKDSIEKTASFAFTYLSTRSNRLGKVKNEAKQAGNKLIKAAKTFSQQCTKATIPEFIAFLDSLSRLHLEFTKKSMLLWLFTAPLIEKKINLELGNYTEEVRKQIFAVMSLPREKSYSQKEEEEFSQLVARVRKQGIEKCKRPIERFSKKYFWFPFEYVGPAIWDVPAVTKRVKENLHGHTDHVFHDPAQEQKACIKKNKLPKEAIKLFSLLQAITLLQDDRKMIHSHLCYYLNGIIMAELAKRFNVSVDESHYIDATLLQDYLHHKKEYLVQQELRKRTGYLLINQKGYDYFILTGEKAKRKIHKLGIDLQHEANVKEIRGIPAQKGKVNGAVRIIKTSSGTKNLSRGFILVTGMTTPDFVPLIKKAAAIVTDEGGITSHAAIVAREMKKPCIIGTKIATKVLKDGDYVEVDADKGIVKIIKKGKL